MEPVDRSDATAAVVMAAPGPRAQPVTTRRKNGRVRTRTALPDSAASTTDGEKAAQVEAVVLERRVFERLLADLTEQLADIVNDDFPVGIERVLRHLLAILGYDRCTFSEFVAGDYLNVLCSVGANGFDGLPRGRFHFPLKWFLSELRSGRIVKVSNPSEDLPSTAVEEAEHCASIGLRSHLSIPVRIGGRVIGVLSFAAMRQAYRWSPDLVSQLKIVGEVMGSAIAIARSEEQAQALRRHVWHADRVQRVSTLTAAIAHELKQPLAAILSNAQAGLKYLEQDKVAPDAIQSILEAVVRESKRAAETIHSMRAQMRPGETRRERIDLAAAMGEAKRLLKGELAAQGVRIEPRFEDECWVMADKVQLEQVVLNLLLNAAAALQNVPPERRVVHLEVARRHEHVTMKVSDAGKGIGQADLTSIFEPFWTTRDDGVGLGLAICRSIVEAHGGRIWADSDPEGETTFSVELSLAPAGAYAPRVDPNNGLPVAAQVHGTTAAARANDRSLVCVIDDDLAVRMSLLRLLDGAGLTAVGFESASKFLLDPPPGDIGCVLLDVQMPGLSGLQLQQRLAERGSMSPIIFITGHGDLASGVDAMKHGAADFLQKPVDGEILLAAVRRAQERHAGERTGAMLRAAMKERVARLSAREREIMMHVIRGRLNKQIAAELLITMQTVKQHRGRVMKKMNVRSVADLVRACETAGLVAGAHPA